MSLKINFSNACRDILISEVQTKPALWNDQHADYKKTDTTKLLWDEVAAEVGLSSGKDAKMKWKNLKDKFRIELRKTKQSVSTNENYKSKWPFFKKMLFARNTIFPSTRTGNLSQQIHNTDSDGEAETADNIDDTDSDIVQPETPTLSSPISCSSSSNTHSNARATLNRNNKRSAEKEIDRYFEIEKKEVDVFEHGLKKSANLANNSEYHFLMSLLPYFDELDCLEKLEVRGKIQTLVTDAIRRKRH